MVITRIDTIVAVATPPGRGGIGAIRVSGPAVREIISVLLKHTPQPRYAHYCKFRDQNGEIIDQGLALFFPAPASYTGEDVIELYAHGSRIILEQLVSRIVSLGARRARPGEFTERAFLNHKIDLAQAEAVADVVDAVSIQAARSAVRSLTGEFSRSIQALREKLIQIRVIIEGALDFPDEDADFYLDNDTGNLLQACLGELALITTRARQGALLREGINAVIAGRPNVGKSTLMNRLAGEDAAIVSEIPGTTRDLIERDILVDGIPVHLTDTAGLRTTGNTIELEGIRRARDATAKADLIMLIMEYGQQPGAEEQELLESTDAGKPVIILYNKIDVAGVEPGISKNMNQPAEIYISARTGAGTDLLAGQMKEYLGVHDLGEDVFMARKRHLDALERARQALIRAGEGYRQHTAAELLAEDLRFAQQALGEITGEFAADDLLGEIFRNFCIGK